MPVSGFVLATNVCNLVRRDMESGSEPLMLELLMSRRVRLVAVVIRALGSGCEKLLPPMSRCLTERESTPSEAHATPRSRTQQRRQQQRLPTAGATWCRTT